MMTQAGEARRAGNSGDAEVTKIIWTARLGICCCAVVPLTIAATFCGVYWTMWTQAQDFDRAGDAMGMSNYYDSCGSLGSLGRVESLESQGGSTVEMNTKWSVVLAFNSILYLLLTITTLSIVLGSCFMPALVFAACGICCGGMAELAAIIVTAVMRYSRDGEKCAKYTLAVASNGDTFEDHGNKIQALFISQCVLTFVLQCFIGCNFTFAMQVGGLSCAQWLTRSAR